MRGEIRESQAVFQFERVTEHNHAAIGIDGAGNCLNRTALTRSGIPFQADGNAGIQAASAALVVVLGAYTLQFAQLKGHLSLLKVMLELERIWVNGTFSRGRLKEYLSVGTGGRQR